MFFKRKLLPRVIGFGLGQIVVFLIISLTTTAQNNNAGNRPAFAGDTTLPKGLPYPIHDNRGDFMSSGKRSTFDFNKPANITDSVAYDFNSHLYTLYEKIGGKYYRTPTTYTFEEYWQMKGRQSEIDYFKKRANTMNLLNRKLTKPKLSLYNNLFNRLFGNGKIEISPQGNVDVTAGYQGQNIKNPTLPERARKNGGFDPITYESLVAVVDLWSEMALTLTTRDLRLMERLARAQVRKVGGAEEGAVEEIKRMELDTAWGELQGTGLSKWGGLGT